MANTLKRILTADRQRLFALAMLPVFVVGTLPQSACICADGHREAACPKLKGGRDKRAKSCCAGKSHERASEPGPTNEIGAKASTCCRVVIEATPATAVAKDSGAAQASSRIVSSDFVGSHLADATFRPLLSDVAHCQPPPRDAVILFLRLTI